MKRCPQCEFTFEDHENFCDFDGSELSPIFERPLSSQSYSTLNHVLMPMVRGLLRSNFSLAVLALAGIVFSALLVGYYSATDVQSKGEAVEAIPALVTQELVRNSVASVATLAVTIAATAPPKAKALTARRSRTSSRSASLQFARASLRSAAFRSRKPSSSSLRVANLRRTYIQPQLEAKSAVHASSQLIQARDQKHVEALQLVKPSRSVVSQDKVKLTGGHSSSTGGKSFVQYPQKKDSKFIAAMKKTGRVLSWPFRL
jgi:hypothetical protein